MPAPPSTGAPNAPNAPKRLDDAPNAAQSGGDGATPGNTPPPYMYQEPWTPPAGETVPPPDRRGGGAPGPYAAGPYPPGAYPPPYIYAPPPYAPLRSRTPWNALWIGVRGGAIFPYGRVWDVPNNGFRYGESWRGLATSGLSLEGNVGIRLARHYILYGFWEHGWLGTGSDPSWRTANEGDSNFGEQTMATTDFAGAGFRWSSNPERVGIVLDIGLGHRWFRERWSSSLGRTRMDLEGFGELRIGIGAEIRVNRLFALSPLLSVSTGSFTKREITLPNASTTPIQSLEGSHGTVTFTLGGHFDLGS